MSQLPHQLSVDFVGDVLVDAVAFVDTIDENYVCLSSFAGLARSHGRVCVARPAPSRSLQQATEGVCPSSPH